MGATRGTIAGKASVVLPQFVLRIVGIRPAGRQIHDDPIVLLMRFVSGHGARVREEGNVTRDGAATVVDEEPPTLLPIVGIGPAAGASSAPESPAQRLAPPASACAAGSDVRSTAGFPRPRRRPP